MPLAPTPPHYLRIRDQLADEISRGVLAADQQLPAERDLAERFACTRITLREALQQLEAEGRIYRESRRGWFVCPPRIRYDPTRLTGFMDYVAEQGRVPRTECLRAEQRAAGPELAARMGLASADEPVFWLERRRWVDRRPVLLEYNVLVASWCPQLLSHDLNTSLTTLLRERYGREQRRCQLSLQLGTVDEAEAELLQLSPGASSLCLERLGYGEQGQPVEFDREYWRPDALLMEMATRYPGLPPTTPG